MQKIINHLKANIVQWLALVVLLSSMGVASRAAVVPVLGALGRFVLPFIVLWIIFKVIKNRLNAAVKRFQDQMFQTIQNNGAVARGGQGSGQVIDLCPKCGSLKDIAHSCP
jgi:hypothetical protein